MPHRGYELSNLTGNIKRNRDRLATVRARQERTEAAEATGVHLEQCVGGYVRVTFADKPDRDTLDGLKAAGFHYGRGSWTGKGDQLPEGITPVKALPPR